MKKRLLLLIMLLNISVFAEAILSSDGKRVTGYRGETITSVIIPDGVEVIGESAFRNCEMLSQVSIPSSVTTICEGAFEGCSNLIINIPSSVTDIAEGAFLEVRRVNIASGNARYCNTPQGAVIDRRSKTLLHVPPEFRGVYRIPNGIKHIGKGAFYSCCGVTEIIFSAEVKTIGEWAFYDCQALEKVSLNRGLESIGSLAFWNTGIRQLRLPASITTLEAGSLAGVAGVSLDGGNSRFRVSSGGVVTEPGRGRLIFCPPDKTHYRIPQGITNIDDNAFAKCRQLARIFIPEGVVRIGDSAFYGCSQLSELIFPESVRSIGTYAFLHCNNLERVTIRGAAVVSSNAFCDNCRSGKPITLQLSRRVRMHREQVLPQGSRVIRR